MEFEGEKFAKNVQMKQEKADLQNQIDSIDEQLSDSPYQPQENHPSLDEDAVMVDIPEQELGDLILDDAQNETDKKKYIILGLALLLLFVLTVLIIKLMTSIDESKTNNSLIDAPNKELIDQDKALNNTDIEKQYQNIIKKKMEEIKKEEIPLHIEETKKAIEPIKKDTPNKKDIFDMETKSENIIKKLKKEEKKAVKETKPKPTVKKAIELFEEKKQTVKTPVITNFKKTSTNMKPTGVFIQIGAFSKTPNDTYLNKIKNNGYQYNLYKVEVKGKLYVKVLVGPFSSKTQAKENLQDIKSKLNAKSAYILKF
ncbi:MAG: SPOR domain-containing protein [Campylobacterota bacterium]|nr:SPOR domain-containing protein [Campylobacterota bacterium]